MLKAAWLRVHCRTVRSAVERVDSAFGDEKRLSLRKGSLAEPTLEPYDSRGC